MQRAGGLCVKTVKTGRMVIIRRMYRRKYPPSLRQDYNYYNIDRCHRPMVGNMLMLLCLQLFSQLYLSLQFDVIFVKRGGGGGSTRTLKLSSSGEQGQWQDTVVFYYFNKVICVPLEMQFSFGSDQGTDSCCVPVGGQEGHTNCSSPSGGWTVTSLLTPGVWNRTSRSHLATLGSLSSLQDEICTFRTVCDKQTCKIPQRAKSLIHTCLLTNWNELVAAVEDCFQMMGESR